MWHSLIIITILLISSGLTFARGDSLKTKSVDTLKITTTSSSYTLVLKPTDSKTENKSSFDWKIWLPTFTTLFALLVTNLITLYKIQRDSKEAIKKEIIISKIKIERDRLEKFYDPIFTTLKSNSSFFNSYGPQTFPRDNGVLETEASEVWNQIIQNIIIPNNEKINGTIQKFSHLITSNDSISKYLEYLVHADSFQHFIKYPNTLHKKFKYPIDFLDHVDKIRNDIVNNLEITENKLST